MSEASAAGRLQQSMRISASDRQKIDSVTDRIIKLYGLIETIGTGEALFDISFAAQFLELPSYSRGWHLSEGQVVSTGSYPSCDMGVHSFAYETKPNGIRYYTGAKMLFVITGIPGQRIVSHYQFEGRAIVPPVNTAQLAEDIV